MPGTLVVHLNYHQEINEHNVESRLLLDYLASTTLLLCCICHHIHLRPGWSCTLPPTSNPYLRWFIPVPLPQPVSSGNLPSRSSNGWRPVIPITSAQSLPVQGVPKTRRELQPQSLATGPLSWVTNQLLFQLQLPVRLGIPSLHH